MRQVKKWCLGLLFVANLKEPRLRTQVNRLVQPAKIADGLMMVCIFRRVLKTTSFCISEAHHVAYELTQQITFFGIVSKFLILVLLISLGGAVWKAFGTR